MSIVDFSKISTKALVVQYVLDCSNAGFMLPYDDYEIIETWLQKTRDVDELLLILSDLLPRYFERRVAKGGRPGSLKGIHRAVLKKIKDNSLRTPQKNRLQP